MEIKSKHYCLYPYDDTTLAMIVYKSRLANQMNKWLNYPYDAIIKPGEEPLFLITDKKVGTVIDNISKGYMNVYVKTKMGEFFMSDRNKWE